MIKILIILIMRKKCHLCNKQYDNIVQHLLKSSCVENARRSNVPTVPHDIFLLPSSIAGKAVSIDEARALVSDNIPNNDPNEVDLATDVMDDSMHSATSFLDQSITLGNNFDVAPVVNNHMDWYHLLNSQNVTTTVNTNYYRRIEEYILQGIVEEFSNDHNEDNSIAEDNVTNINIGDDGHHTMEAEPPFFLCLLMSSICRQIERMKVKQQVLSKV